MYDVMTSGTYFWNIVKKRIFQKKVCLWVQILFETILFDRNVRQAYVTPITEYGSYKMDSLGRMLF